MITLFDNLADLSLIEIFSYLSCLDAIYSFTNLNTRLTGLLKEQGFYRHVNLSSTRYHQFQSILSLFRLNEIESLVIDCHASPLQLKSWPYLPNLRTSRVKGIRDWVDVFNFAQQHANTLTHLTVESSKDFSTIGMANGVCYPLWNLCDFIKNALKHLCALRLLDFGIEKTKHLHHWPLRRIGTHLTYLRITLLTPFGLFNLMNTKPLSRTLQQLHITMSDVASSPHPRFPDTIVWPRMEVLHTFTFIKSFNWHFSQEWFLLDTLTCSNVMPLLRRMNFCIVTEVNDLDRIYHSPLFIDYRNVDVQYAFMINDDREHIHFIDYVRHFNQSHRRQIVSATFISECWPNIDLFKKHDLHYLKKPKNRQHLFYTLPWIFNESVQLCVPDRCISNLQVFKPSSLANINSFSRLVKLNVSDNLPSFVAFLPHIVSSNQIVELYLLVCDRRINLNLPSVSRLTLIDSLDSLINCTLLTNIQSIQIVLHHQCLRFRNDDWTVLRTISTLPRLKSLRLVLYDMRITPDSTSCQIIAETAPIVTDFGFCFRRYAGETDYDINAVCMKQSLFIEELQNRILALPLNKQPYIIRDQDGHGIIIWF